MVSASLRYFILFHLVVTSTATALNWIIPRKSRAHGKHKAEAQGRKPDQTLHATRSGDAVKAAMSKVGTSSFTKAWTDGALKGAVADIYKVEALQHGGGICLEQCAQQGGMCSYCGVGNACCKRVSETFWHSMDPPECGRVPTTSFLTAEHECVALPSAMAGDCGVVHSRTTSTQRYFSMAQKQHARARYPHDWKFYMYDLPPSLNNDLLKCYLDENEMEIWEDERKERAQNTAEVWVHKMLENHPRRTRDPSKAKLFYVPFYGALSAHFSGVPKHKLNPCNGLGHLDRVDALVAFMREAKHFDTPEKQARHSMTVSYWGVTTRSYPHWEEWLDTSYAVLTGPLREAFRKVRILVYEPHFGGFGDPEEFKYWDGPVSAIPYVPDHHLVEPEVELPAQRLFSVYFRGNMELDSSNKTSGIASDGQITRCQAFQSARDVPGSRLVDSSTNFSYDAYVEEMLSATFCLVPRGDTPTSRRLFDAIVAGCIPVVVADEIALPFENIVDWDKFSLRISEADSGGVMERVSAMTESEVRNMQQHLLDVRDDFVYGWGSPEDANPGRAVENILLTLASA